MFSMFFSPSRLFLKLFEKLSRLFIVKLKQEGATLQKNTYHTDTTRYISLFIRHL